MFVDGAHAFAHFPFTRDELECDYYGTSLHKWLLAPIGTGFLYVRKEKQKKIWPLMAAPAEMDENIRKYEEIGTHPAANHNAIAAALAFHRGIGAERKAARLRFLRDRWAKRLAAVTAREDPDAAERHGLVRDRARPRRGLDPGSCGAPLGQAPDHDHAHRPPGVQRPPHHPDVYTTLDEVDVFCSAWRRSSRTGLPACSFRREPAAPVRCPFLQEGQP